MVSHLLLVVEKEGSLAMVSHLPLLLVMISKKPQAIESHLTICGGEREIASNGQSSPSCSDEREILGNGQPSLNCRGESKISNHSQSFPRRSGDREISSHGQSSPSRSGESLPKERI